MASPSSEERVTLQDKIKAQGEVVRKLKAAKEGTDEAKQQVYKVFITMENGKVHYLCDWREENVVGGSS